MNKVMQRRFCWQSQQGVALITALLVVALATTAAVSMATRLHVDMRRTGNVLHGEQAYAYGLAAESWAQVVLKQDRDNNSIDSRKDDWATALPPISVEGGVVDGRVEDLQGRFNVNNLVDSKGVKAPLEVKYYERLLDRLKLEPSLAPVLLDWIDADINASFPGGAEDEAYLLLDPPYRAANRLIADISELRLLQGYTREVIEALAPHVTALPVATLINANTATAEVLLALDEKLDAAAIATLVTDRNDEPFKKFDDFRGHDAMAGIDLGIVLGVTSEWFRVSTDVTVGTGHSRVRSLVHRGPDSIEVISRVRTRVNLLSVPPPE